MGIKEIEKCIQSLPASQMVELKADPHFKMASILYIMATTKFQDKGLVQMCEDAVIQAFDAFIGQGDLQ